MSRVIILPKAKEDIRDATKWYNSKQTSLGKRFTKKVRERVHFIRKNPKSFSIRFDNIRAAVVEVFPFLIHYSFGEKQNIIVVFAVFHTSRNPEVLKARL